MPQRTNYLWFHNVKSAQFNMALLLIFLTIWALFEWVELLTSPLQMDPRHFEFCRVRETLAFHNYHMASLDWSEHPHANNLGIHIGFNPLCQWAPPFFHVKNKLFCALHASLNICAWRSTKVAFPLMTPILCMVYGSANPLVCMKCGARRLDLPLIASKPIYDSFHCTVQSSTCKPLHAFYLVLVSFNLCLMPRAL